jgi:hypothetical protein
MRLAHMSAVFFAGAIAAAACAVVGTQPVLIVGMVLMVFGCAGLAIAALKRDVDAFVFWCVAGLAIAALIPGVMAWL